MMILRAIMSSNDSSSGEEFGTSGSSKRKPMKKPKRRRKYTMNFPSSDSEDENSAACTSTAPEHPAFRCPNWTVEKLLAKRRSHLPATSGASQMEFFVQWSGEPLEASAWVPAEFIDSWFVQRFEDIPVLTSSSEGSDTDATSMEEAAVTTQNDLTPHRRFERQRVAAAESSRSTGSEIRPRHSPLRNGMADGGQRQTARKRITIPERRIDNESTSAEDDDSSSEKQNGAITEPPRDSRETNGKAKSKKIRLSTDRSPSSAGIGGLEEDAETSSTDSEQSVMSTVSNAEGSSSVNDRPWQPGQTDDENDEEVDLDNLSIEDDLRSQNSDPEV
ncbi:uncharacterized protein LOC129581772 isoform X2 [Paramacrobiotus metropolitanus]|uniref:uncharacterized protein LOC129581772 isoform X2 n=1 Tax=Paramacrobiotus metropolitanus TaxID=2943436 RepID=UPI0024459674|nr:uncharacterized protein LOC129581772 isoform X2 [Paramacrobiotus metropolitanus]